MIYYTTFSAESRNEHKFSLLGKFVKELGAGPYDPSKKSWYNKTVLKNGYLTFTLLESHNMMVNNSSYECTIDLVMPRAFYLRDSNMANQLTGLVVLEN